MVFGRYIERKIWNLVRDSGIGHVSIIPLKELLILITSTCDIFFDGTVSRPPANLCSRIRFKSDTGDDTDRRMLLDITGNDSRYW